MDVGLGLEGSILLIKTLTSLNLDCAARTLTASPGFTIGSMRRSGGIANGIDSTRNPVVNTDMMRGNGTKGNAIASLSNGFSLGIGPNTAVIVACVNCRGRRVIMNGRSGFGIAVGASSGALRRIIIMNCNIRGGGLIANSAVRIGNSSVRGVGAARILNTLRDRAPNIGVRTTSNRPNSNFGVSVHNTNAGNGATPLCVVSNMTNSVGGLGPTSVRHVSMLGSTTSYTVCNSTTTGNIVLMAAGRNGRNGVRMSCSTGMN